MKAEQFVFWLQGFFEISDAQSGSKSKKTKLDETQVEMIKQHLALVFFHEIDPTYSSDPKVQEKMNQIHSGKKTELLVEEVDMSKDIITPAIPEKKPFRPSGGGMFPSERDVVYRC